MKIKIIDGRRGEIWHEADNLDEAISSIRFLYACNFGLDDESIIIVLPLSLERSVK